MKKFLISEEEKKRILGMHKDATKRNYLSEQKSNLDAMTAKAVNAINQMALRGQRPLSVILPEQPTIIYTYPGDPKKGETPYWANGVYVYNTYVGQGGEKPTAPYIYQYKTISQGQGNQWTSEDVPPMVPQPNDILGLQSFLGKENFKNAIVAALNKNDENTKQQIKTFVNNSKEFPAEYKQIIQTA
jgi:hypothetical protein